MGVKVSLCKFYGFANHDSHGNMGDAFLVGKAKCIPDVVTVVNERLCREIGKAGTEIIFTFCPGIDYDAGTSECSCDLDFFTDRVDESLGGEGADDTGSSDDGDSPGNTQSRVECLFCQFATSRYGYTDGDAGMKPVRVKQLFYLVSNHAAGSLVNGGFPDGYADSGQGDRTDTLTGKELYAGLGG